VVAGLRAALPVPERHQPPEGQYVREDRCHIAGHRSSGRPPLPIRSWQDKRWPVLGSRWVLAQTGRTALRKAATPAIGDHVGDPNDLAMRLGRRRASQGLGGVPLDTITDAILAGSPNLGYSDKAPPIPKPRAEVRVLPGALSEFGTALSQSPNVSAMVA
jgi:hypothetical protein